jgi:hypothetical protein
MEMAAKYSFSAWKYMSLFVIHSREPNMDGKCTIDSDDAENVITWV